MILPILLIGHILGDFYFQWDKLAKNKTRSLKKLMMHCMIYLVVFSIINLSLLEWHFAILSVLIIAVSHFLIDLIKYFIERKTKLNPILIFIFDQLLHILCIICVHICFNLNCCTNNIYSTISSYECFNYIVLYILLFLTLAKPVSIFIKKVLLIVPDVDKNLSESNILVFDEEGANKDSIQMVNAGNFIGILERFIIAILILVGQYSVIGLVLTAKSIARFKQLENKDFAERYLMGTLLSTLLAVVATLIVKDFL